MQEKLEKSKPDENMIFHENRNKTRISNPNS